MMLHAACLICAAVGQSMSSQVRPQLALHLNVHAHPCLHAEQRIMSGVTDVAFSFTGRLMFASYDEETCRAWETISKEGCVAYTHQFYNYMMKLPLRVQDFPRA
jgi:hypothetical protein